MLMKEKDPADKAIQTLETIKQNPNLPKDKLFLVEKELKTLKAGNDGETNSAYFIDFYLRNRNNWAVIHDLRLECRDNVAQIDHLLINRFLEFYVLETKSYAYGLKINELGEFSSRYGNRDYGIESPIEQNKRHIRVLESVLKDNGLLPSRLGRTLPPTFKSYIVVAPKSTIDRPKASKFDTSMIVKADIFLSEIQAESDSASDSGGAAYVIGMLAKVISSDSLTELAQRLIRYHTPVEFDYYTKFGVQAVQAPPLAVQADLPGSKEAKPSSKYYCFKCKRPIDERVARYCFDHRERFGGKAYCLEHQKDF